jgi:XTP/dITP diphosphohydrolase
MKNPLLYATGNPTKFRTAVKICETYGVALEQASLEIPEIQDDDGEIIARDKALRIFEQLQKPVVITDDSWLIPGLKGFPGPYMKYVNHTFTAEDWLRLTLPLTDRRIILRQAVVYQDKGQQQLFRLDVEALLLKDIRGICEFPHASLVSFDGGKTSAAEHISQARSALGDSEHQTSWHDFCEWYQSRNNTT